MLQHQWHHKIVPFHRYANHLVNSISAYANRYGISNVNNDINIVKSNDDKCKKLVKFLEENR